MIKRLLTLAIGIAYIATPVSGQVSPYLNPALSADERAADLLSRLTLDEKIGMMTHESAAVPRLGIPAYNWWNEALHGVGRAGVATVFPQAIALAATFDDKGVYESFDMVSDEARVKYNRSVRDDSRGQYRGLTFWTPNINIFRDPRWGRGQETYGEDPYLTATMGLAVIRGLQGDGSGRYDKLHACAKHYAVHSGPEWSRHTYNASAIDPADLWETYLPAFKAAVVDGNVRQVMCAYNRFEDEPCCSSKKLLKRILRDRWGYDGVVLSDCGALGDFYRPAPGGHGTHATPVDAAADALLTGNDLECGDNAYPAIRQSLAKGLITEADIDRSVLRLLRARFSLGNLFDDELTEWWSLPDSLIACDAHRAKALEMARKSIVLLTNKDDALPLSPESIRRIAVVGPNAVDSLMMWGNYNGYPKSTVTILEGIREKFPRADVSFVKGCDLATEKAMISDFGCILSDGKPGMKGSFWSNREMTGEPVCTRHFGSPLSFTNNGETAFAPDVPVLNFSARFEGVFVPRKSGPVSFCLEGDDGFRLLIDGKPVIDQWYDGIKSEIDYELDAEKGREYDIVLEYYQAGGGADLKFDIGRRSTVDYRGVASSVKDADVIIFVGGLSPHLEGEEMGVNLPGFRGGDRTAIELPRVQERMLMALKATGRPVIFVLCTGSAVAIPWAAENCDAVLNVFYPGEVGGTAVADVIAGDYNPAGRLPVTYYASTDDLPDFENYSMAGRTYRYFKGKPLFPFGHGLSYTAFEYGRASIAVEGDEAIVSIPLANVGPRDGDEVVQVYVRERSRRDGPLKSLKAFSRVHLSQGQADTVRLALPRAAFEAYSTDLDSMVVRPVDYDILYGGTSDDSKLRCVSFLPPASFCNPAAAGKGEKTRYPFTFAPSRGIVDDTERPYRQELCLNGYWDFQPVSLPADYRQGGGVAPQLPPPAADGWSDTRIKIPSPWNINDFSYNNLEGPDHRNYPSYPEEWNHALMGWLKKDVMIPADWAGETIRLYFEAVAGETVVYVNGVKTGGNFDLFLPFSCDVTDVVTPGEVAEVLVGVRSQKLFEDNSTVGRRIVPAGSMWGYHINGIWQDVFLLAEPKVAVTGVYIKPLVDKDLLEVEVELANNTDKEVSLILTGDISRWINKAGGDVNAAPVPSSALGERVLSVKPVKVAVPARSSVKVSTEAKVDGRLDLWTPESPFLYGLVLSLDDRKGSLDRKYERFGWRQWTLRGDKLCLNGEPYSLRSDSWHFQGIPQMSRRYAWAWYKAIKDTNGNAVRPHAQVYPRFYLDMADEMGICVLDETANWASDGGPKLDSDLFWENSKDHLSRFVKRDRNHPSVFGWSVSNENKPVILYVYNRPDLMPLQVKAWEEWRDIVMEHDPTRPWISSDGEDDGDGILPVTVGHYGDRNSMKAWKAIGKPWGMGEHSMAYYGTPQQVAVYNGERAYESQQGRMEGLAVECYNLIKDQRDMGASFSTVFNMAWYALKPLPLGKRDVAVPPSLDDDGIFFGNYVEGVPGVQPERIGPYSTTFNPGYDPNLPLYDGWPLFDALRAANAPIAPARSDWAAIDVDSYKAPEPEPAASYDNVVYVGRPDGKAKAVLDTQGVIWSAPGKTARNTLYIVDAADIPDAKEVARVAAAMRAGADVWLWGVTPATVGSFADLLPAPLVVESLSRSSFLPVQRSWARGLNNSDLYFCELQTADASRHTLSGQLVEEGEILVNACPTDWRRWNKRPEETKTAGVLRSEYECRAALPVFVKSTGRDRGDLYVSTLTEFANSEKGYNALAMILKNAGVKCSPQTVDPEEVFFLRDGRVQFPSAVKEHLVHSDGGRQLTVYAFSPRPLDDLLVEPDVPKLELKVRARSASLKVGDILVRADQRNEEALFYELPLKQGWNKLTISIGEGDAAEFGGEFSCRNNSGFMPQLKVAYTAPESDL